MKKSLVMLFPVLFCGLSWHAQAQTLDSSGDSMLNGTYYFRQVLYVSDEDGDFVDAASVYGNITFNGSGSYSMSGSVCDYNNGCTSTASALSTTGTYVIGANGFGYITSPYVTGDLVYGLVSNGIFVASTTETTNLYIDFFVAAPVGSTPAANATLKGTYTIAYTDATVPLDALFQATADGQGNLGTINASGFYEPGGTTSSGEVEFSSQEQTLTGVKYAFSDGPRCERQFRRVREPFPATSDSIYVSPDGNFIFGGAFTMGLNSSWACAGHRGAQF